MVSITFFYILFLSFFLFLAFSYIYTVFFLSFSYRIRLVPFFLFRFSALCFPFVFRNRLSSSLLSIFFSLFCLFSSLICYAVAYTHARTSPVPLHAFMLPAQERIRKKGGRLKELSSRRLLLYPLQALTAVFIAGTRLLACTHGLSVVVVVYSRCIRVWCVTDILTSRPGDMEASAVTVAAAGGVKFSNASTRFLLFLQRNKDSVQLLPPPRILFTLFRLPCFNRAPFVSSQCCAIIAFHIMQ